MITLDKDNINLFTLITQFKFGLVKDEELDDWLYNFEKEKRKNANDKAENSL